MELVPEQERAPLIVSGLVVLLLMAGAYTLLATQQGTAPQVNRAYWDIARAAGYVAYEVLAVTILCGLFASLVRPGHRIRRDLRFLHQFTAVLVFPFFLLHVWALHLDTTIPYPWWRILIPLGSTFRPLFTAFGTLTLYALVAVVLSSALQRHIGVRTWRTIHGLWLPMFIGATCHGLFVGTDAVRPWSIWLYGVPSALFVLLVLLRFVRRFKQRGV